MMHKIVYNSDYGPYHLPEEVLDRYNELAGTNHDITNGYEDNIPRHDPNLATAVEAYIKHHGIIHTSLAIAVTFNSRYIIMHDNGMERVITPDNAHWIVIE